MKIAIAATDNHIDAFVDRHLADVNGIVFSIPRPIIMSLSPTLRLI